MTDKKSSTRVFFSANDSHTGNPFAAVVAGGLSGTSRVSRLTLSRFNALMWLTISSLLADGFVHPIDTIRSRLQFQKGTGPDILYRTTFGTAKHILSREGPLAFYKGFGSVAMFTMGGHALYFGGYEYAKKKLHFDPEKEQSPASHFAAGLFADFWGALLWCPQDVIKQRLQVQENERGKVGKYRNSVHAMRAIVAEEGVRGLYRGFAAGLLVYAPLVGMHFMIYERIKRTAARTLKRDPHDLPALVYLGGAALSASSAALVTTPLDVVKTRLQVQTAASGGYRGVWHGLTSIAREEGGRAFFKGSLARMLWIGPNAALAMAFCATEDVTHFKTPIDLYTHPVSDEQIKKRLGGNQ